jgi:hypothetical protein
LQLDLPISQKSFRSERKTHNFWHTLRSFLDALMLLSCSLYNKRIKILATRISDRKLDHHQKDSVIGIITKISVLGEVGNFHG